MYKIFLFLFVLLISIKSYSNDKFCNSYFSISFFPFTVVYLNQFEYDTKNYNYLKEGIPRLIYSNLKEQFFIEESFLPVLKTNFKNQNNNKENCKPYLLAKIFLEFNVKINSEFFLAKSEELKTIREDLYNQSRNLAISKDFKAFLVGLILVKEKELEIEILYVNLVNPNYNFSIKFSLEKDDPYSEKNLKIIYDHSLKIQNTFYKNSKKFVISAPKDYQVYVNQISYGKNVEEIFLPNGDFFIEIFKDGCKRSFYSRNIDNKIIFDCEKEVEHKINISSEPEGALIFIDENFIGQTPKEVLIAKKVVRARISKEGYLEKYIVLDFNQKKQNQINVKLLRIENQKEKNIVSNWTYYDLSFGVAIQSLLFASGWAYSNVQKEKVLDSVRSILIPTFFFSPLEFKVEHYYILEKARKRSLYWHSQGQIFGGLGLLSLFLSGFFLYKGIMIDIQTNPYHDSYSFYFTKNF